MSVFNPFEPGLDSNFTGPVLCIDCTPISLSWLCPHYLNSGDVSYAPTHTQRPPGGLSPGMGYQRELQLSAWLRAVLPCCAHLHREWDMERRPASVLAWVTILYFHYNYNDDNRGLLTWLKWSWHFCLRLKHGYLHSELNWVFSLDAPF